MGDPSAPAPRGSPGPGAEVGQARTAASAMSGATTVPAQAQAFEAQATAKRQDAGEENAGRSNGRCQPGPGHEREPAPIRANSPSAPSPSSRAVARCPLR